MNETSAYILCPLVVINSLIFIMFGFLLQWPTILTLVMFPILVWMYVWLARQEKKTRKKPRLLSHD